MKIIVLLACLVSSPLVHAAAFCAADGATPAPTASCCAAEATKAVPAAAWSARSLYQSDATFTNDRGEAVALGQFQGRPVVLAMVFTHCGYACPLIVTDLLALQASLPAALRREVQFVLVSFDPSRDTPAALASYRANRQLDGNWTLLTGDDEAVRELAALLAVSYKAEADGAFSHTNVFTLLNGAGEIVHQRTGLKGGLVEALAALQSAAASKP